MTIQFGWSLQGRGLLAGREAITTLAKRADALGYDSVWVTDRLVIPTAGTTSYPYSATGGFPIGPDEPWLEALTAVTYRVGTPRPCRRSPFGAEREAPDHAFRRPLLCSPLRTRKAGTRAPPGPGNENPALIDGCASWRRSQSGHGAC